MIPLVCFLTATVPTTVDSIPEFGLKHLTKVCKEFRLSDGLYRETLGKKEPAFNWAVGVLIPALNTAARLKPEWKSELQAVIKSSKRYWNPKGPTPGFDVWPSPKPVDRFYDDNAWMVIGLIESYEILGDPEVLDLAKKSLSYVLSGFDTKLGGGIYWREKIKDSKNTCSNAPAVVACLEVYKKTMQPELLEKAIKIYDWTKSKLQDPNDLLLWDSIRLNGHIDRTKWTYNTALMIRSAAALHEITKDEKYLIEAKVLADASEKKWLVKGRIADEGKFAFLLLDSWKFVPSESRKKGHQGCSLWLRASGRDDKGWFGHRFDREPSVQATVALIDQCAAIRTILTTPVSK